MSGLPPLPSHLRIFPTRVAAEAAVRLRPGECVTTEAHETFPSLLLALGAQGGRRYASPLACRVLLRELLREADATFANAAGDPYVVRAVHRALGELRAAGVTAGHLAGVRLSAPLAALARLLVAYEEALEAADLADDADWERQGVLAAARGHMPPALAGVTRVTVEGGASLFGSRLDLLSALASRGLQVRVRVPWDPERRDLFAWPEAGLHSLERRAHPGVEVLFDDRKGDGPLASLRAAQLSGAVVAGAPARLVQAPSRAELLRRVALEVAAWLRGGVPADAVAVAVPDLDDLGPPLVAVLEAAGLPAYTRRGPRLQASPAGRALELALALPAEGHPREALLELWRCLGRTLDTPAGAWHADEVAAEVRRAGARSARLWSYGDALRSRAAREAERGRAAAAAPAEAAAEALVRLCSELDSLPARAPFAELVRGLEARVAALGLAGPELRESAGDPDGALAARRVLLAAQARAHAGVQAVRELLDELHQAALLVRARDWSRDELAGLVRLLMDERRLPPSGARTGKVAVLGLDDLVEARFRCVLLAGVEAESFPRPLAPDAVLTDELRVEVNRLLGPRLLQSAPLEGREGLRAAARDGWVWMEALAAASDEIVACFCAADRAEEASQSELVDELHRSLGRPPLEPAAPVYACGAGPSLLQALQGLSLCRPGGPARVNRLASGGRAVALEQALAARAARCVDSIHARIRGAQALERSPRRTALLSAAHQRLLEAHFTGQVQSTSRLDLLGVCAFRQFAGALLGLSREELPALGADVREEGSAAHAALCLVYRDLAARGGLARARQDKPAALARARTLVEAGGAEILAEVVVHPALAAAVVEDAWAVVLAQLTHDLNDDSSLEPTLLEYRFDDRGRGAAPLEIPEPAGSRAVRVRGSIDRIDRAQGELVTLDYKRTPRKRSLGRHFQLPVYALVAARDLASETEPHRVSAAWVRLRDAKRHHAAGVDATAAELAHDTSEALWARLRRVLGGDVSPDPDGTDPCGHCDFIALCRYHAELGAEQEEEA